MKSFIVLLLAAVTLSGYAQKESGETVVKTYPATESSLYEEYFDEGKIITVVEYYELDDGTYKTKDGNIYKYRLEIKGRMHSAVRDSTFVYLSNTEDITFDMAWKAAGYSSNTNDYFSPETAVLVALG